MDEVDRGKAQAATMQKIRSGRAPTRDPRHRAQMDEVDRGRTHATTMQKIHSGRGSDHQIRGELNTTAMKKLRIATLNDCTLKGVKRHQRLFDILQEQQVDICALQETRMTDYAYPSFVQMAKRRGYL